MKLRTLFSRNGGVPVKYDIPLAKPKSVAERAVDLFDNSQGNLSLSPPEEHRLEPIIPLVGTTTICALNYLLPLMPGDRKVFYQSRSAGDSLHEELRITYSAVTLRMNIVGAYINWDLEFDDSPPNAFDDELVALALSGRIGNGLAAIINSHAGLNAGTVHPD